MRSKKSYSRVTAIGLALLLSGCAQQTAVSIDKASLPAPKSWSEQDKIGLQNHDEAWLQSLLPQQLLTAIEKALTQNYELQQQKFALQALEQTAIASGASLWPSLNLTFGNSRRYQADSDSYSTSHDLTLGLSYEVDIWGKLSANDRQVNLQLASQQAAYEQAKSKLIADVVLAWYQVVESSQQLQLNEQRLANAKQNLAIIESGYESGLNQALDV